jgi:hypothetical protein
MCERVSTLFRDALAVEIPSGSVGAARLQRAVVRSEGGTRSREFLFDRTFGPGAAQARARTAAAGVLHAVPPTLRAGRNPRTRMQDDVYGDVGGPIVADVLNGCNGTVFAYGQVRCSCARTRVAARDLARRADGVGQDVHDGNPAARERRARGAHSARPEPHFRCALALAAISGVQVLRCVSFAPFGALFVSLAATVQVTSRRIRRNCGPHGCRSCRYTWSSCRRVVLCCY